MCELNSTARREGERQLHTHDTACKLSTHTRALVMRQKLGSNLSLVCTLSAEMIKLTRRGAASLTERVYNVLSNH